MLLEVLFLHQVTVQTSIFFVLPWQVRLQKELQHNKVHH